MIAVSEAMLILNIIFNVEKYVLNPVLAPVDTSIVMDEAQPDTPSMLMIPMWAFTYFV